MTYRCHVVFAVAGAIAGCGEGEKAEQAEKKEEEEVEKEEM